MFVFECKDIIVTPEQAQELSSILEDAIMYETDWRSKKAKVVEGALTTVRFSPFPAKDYAAMMMSYQETLEERKKED